MSDSAGSHTHSHTQSPSGSSGIATRRALLIAFAVNTLFVFIELFGALYADSLTLLADAIHMVTDSASLLLAIIAAYLATKAADELRTFGYQRVEVLGGFLNALFLLGTVVFIIFDAYQRVQNPQPVKGEIVILVGFVGLLANLVGAYVLHGKESVNARGAYLHLVADAFGSVAAIGSGVIITVTGLHIVDVVFAISVAILILYSLYGLLSETTHILLQGVPDDVAIKEVSSRLKDIDGIIGVHHLHIWALNTSESAASVHIVVPDDADYDMILESALDELESYGVEHPTVQIESESFTEQSHSCFTGTAEEP